MAENKGQSCMYQYHVLFHTQNLDKCLNMNLPPWPFADVAVQQPEAQPGAHSLTALAQAQASHEPVTLVCPACNTQVNTDVEYSMGTCSWIWVIALLLFCLCVRVPRPLRPDLVSSMPLPLALVFRSLSLRYEHFNHLPSVAPPVLNRSITGPVGQPITQTCLCVACVQATGVHPVRVQLVQKREAQVSALQRRHRCASSSSFQLP